MKKVKKVRRKLNGERYFDPPRQRLLIDKTVYDRFSRIVSARKMVRHYKRMAPVIERLMCNYLLGYYDDFLYKRVNIRRPLKIREMDITNSFINKELGDWFAKAAYKEHLIGHIERSAGFIEFLMTSFNEGEIEICV